VAEPVSEYWGSSNFNYQDLEDRAPAESGRQSKCCPSELEDMRPHQRSRTPRATVNKSTLIGQVDPTAVVMMSPQAAALIGSDRKQGTIDPPKRPRLKVDDMDLLIVDPLPTSHVLAEDLSQPSIIPSDVYQPAEEIESHFSPSGSASAPPTPKGTEGERSAQPIDKDFEYFFGTS
jgi:hypothetical protein